MITFKAIIINGNRRKDGTYVVNIRITFKGKVRKLATTLICSPSDLTRSLNIKNPTILSKADEIIVQMREAIQDVTPFDLEDKDVDWVVDHIKHHLSGNNFHLDFFHWCEGYISRLKVQPSTITKYTASLNSLARFLGRRELDINGINRAMLLDYIEFLENEPRMHFDQKTGTLVRSKASKIPYETTFRHFSCLERMFNAAKDKYNDEDENVMLIPKSPFAKIQKVYITHKGQTSIGKELMQQLISYQTDNKVMRTAIDIFVVSFGLMGANMADLYNAKPFKGDTWIYNRQKTTTRRADRAEMKVVVPECLSPFIRRLQEGDGTYWLPKLHQFASTLQFATARVNRCLAKWCEQNKVDKFTFYAARHTWASVCRQDCKVDKSTIDDCLCHKGNYDLADIYAEKAWNLIQETNQKVLELFVW